MRHRRLTWTIVTVIALTVAACGNGAEPADPTTGAAGEGSASGNRATVTVGDTVFDLPSGDGLWACTSTGDLIAGSYALDPSGSPMEPGNPGVGIQVNFVVRSPDAPELQAPTITVQDVSAGTQWQTGEVPDVPEAQLLEWTLVDGVATGSAVFFDLAAFLAGNPPELVEGSFEILCAAP